MILPINRVSRYNCIFCGEDTYRSDYVIIGRGKDKVKRQFHYSCYIKNAEESKRKRNESVEVEKEN